MGVGGEGSKVGRGEGEGGGGGEGGSGCAFSGNSFKSLIHSFIHFICFSFVFHNSLSFHISRMAIIVTNVVKHHFSLKDVSGFSL